MRLSTLVREAWRNVSTGASRALLLCACVLLVALPIQIADLAVTRQHVREAEAYQRAGASVQTLAAPGRIDGEACAALADSATVRAAGAIRTAAADLVAAALPRSPIPLFEVTAGVPGILRSAARPGTGVVLGPEASDALGRGGDLALADGGSVVIRGDYDYPDDGRRRGFGYAALAGAPAGERPFDECWIDAWPQSEGVRALLLTTVLLGETAPDEPPPALAPLNARLGTAFDGGARNAERITVAAVPLGGLLALAACWAATALRRVELASALHSRIHRVELLAILLLESLGWLIPIVAAGLAVALFFSSTGPPLDAGATLVQGLRAPAVALLGAVTGVLLGVLTTRERHLFRYFKNR
ncbi:hypothetical protein HQQ82_14820 [Rathayibacter sp. VKM Ac-2856]|uniref:hypothetical protein n=1 Tax=unclassified Rathayibacter TaxID=2609250 RepID=UPI00156497EF|nr:MULTISPECIES: hypothetical protein [unclassified Rathayibacter]NQX05799.1 hypothetical protein [Rathayibacter sp. VKM Ac-2858]NQX21251.1 hypothetical protein [Rathayibacter sp. VKM Ac-2856]